MGTLVPGITALPRGAEELKRKGGEPGSWGMLRTSSRAQASVPADASPVQQQSVFWDPAKRAERLTAHNQYHAHRCKEQHDHIQDVAPTSRSSTKYSP